MRKYLMAFIALMSTLACTAKTAEETTRKQKRICISEVSLLTGPFTERIHSGSLSDFKNLAPTSELLKSDFSGYQSSVGYRPESNGMLAILLGMQFRGKQAGKFASNPLLRVGVSYQSGTTLSSYLSKNERARFDTLVSSQTGNTVYLDSVHYSQYIMQHGSDQLRFDASLLFRTNPEARWSLYSGIGFNAGISIASYTEISNREYSTVESGSDLGFGGYYAMGASGAGVLERHSHSADYGFSAYVPIGLDFRIGNKREFWKRLHLFYEVRPNIHVNTIAKASTYTGANIQQAFGVKCVWR